MPAVTDYFKKVGSPGNATTLASPGHIIGGTTFTVDSTSLWPTDTGVTFAVDTVSLVDGVEVRDANSYTVWDGIVASATTITNCVLRYGTDQAYSAGSATRVYILPTSTRENKIIDGILSFANQDATLKGTAVRAALGETASTGSGWTALGYAPNTITALGNRSYSVVFNSNDLTGTLSPGMRLRTVRTVAAPTQCTSLNGTSQYYSKSSPAGMTFTDDFVVSAWVKLNAYPAADAVIVSRSNGTSGWYFEVNSSGQVFLNGHNAAIGNYSRITSYQSIPLNKWVHVAGQLDMSAFTATTTTSYIMIDGVDVPALVFRAGTNPTALVQAGNLEIGSINGGTLPFNGKIAQVAIYSAKVTQATILASMHQTLSGSETSLISAYSFNNTINDLNANANNLTANGSAVATNADSPYGGQADGTISSTVDYGIVTKTAFSTNTTLTVQVPEGCTIPTTGGVSAVSYATVKAPYGMPAQSGKWTVDMINRTSVTQATAGEGTWYNLGSEQLNIPIGEWNVGLTVSAMSVSASGTRGLKTILSTGASTGTDTRFGMYTEGNAVTTVAQQNNSRNGISLAASTVYYLNTAGIAVSSTTLYNRGDIGDTRIYAEPAYL
jgi:hypothetical protein